MSISIVKSLQEDEWRRFVEEHPQGNIFHTPEMFQVFKRTKGHRPELWAACKKRRILALMLPVKITLMNGLLRYFTTRSIVYGSVLFVSDQEGEEALSQLLQSYKNEIKGVPLFTELRNLSNMEVIQPLLLKHGFVFEEHMNYLINLNCSTEDILQNIGSRTRKNIRRGIRQGKVNVEELKKIEQVEMCYSLLCKTYRTARVPLADHSLFENAFDLLYPKRMVRFTLARVDDIPVATSVDLLYKGVIYGWYGGVDRAYSSFVPNELLMWHILKWGAEEEYRLYDFGGAGRPNEKYGVRDFKSKFGGHLVYFGRNTFIHSPRLLWFSKKGYDLLRLWL